MNPPPFPPPQPNMFSMATLTLMITVTFLMQASLIAFSARVIKSYRGVRGASIATFAFAFAFLSLVIVTPPTIVSGYFSNFLMICGYFLFYLAISRFTKKPVQPLLVYGLFPVALVTLTVLALFEVRSVPMILVSLFTGFVFNTATVVVIYRSEARHNSLSAILTALPLLVYGVILLGRMIAGMFVRTEILPTPSFSSIFSILALYILSYLWTSGFILMVSQRIQGDLTDLALNDALTRVRNRRAMRDMLDFEMRRKETEVRDFSIILIDVDHFKLVNDTYGHDVGDEVLKWLAASIQSKLRVQDVVARWGGEEFLILLPDSLLNEAMDIAERLRSEIEAAALQLGDTALKITFSGGVANSNSSRNVDELYKIADLALYKAKETRNRVVSQEALGSA